MKGLFFSVLLFCFMNKGLLSLIFFIMVFIILLFIMIFFIIQIFGCEYDGKIYFFGVDILEFSGECYGVFCSGDFGLFFIMYWDIFNCGVEILCKY